ncbi:MAG: hypothetical protein LBE92_18510 [Chryseobacterium sp.]|jgi:hypothetical protein|uniref:hypothetical protein n=1 Tax=Chryseobacterium sp. TaxID=1871047 RepID=UPI00282642FF|nr:hypothetical protein [Chryseobacterium sp.]MDR2238121.1 hypothetical protein [Chryseobacterium sp.]
MSKKIILRLSVLIIFMSLLWSCRSEDLLTDNKETPPSKFKVFTSKNGEKVNYAEGFKILMEKHDSINNEQHTAKAMKNAFESSKNVSDEYIEFNIRSEDFISDTGARWIVYPTIKNSSVTGLIAGILNKDETLVEFRELMPGSEYYDNALPLFREHYQKSLISARQANKNGKCGFFGQPPCEIDVIVITPTNPGGGGPWIPGSGGESPPKGCAKYSNCINPDGGGGGEGMDGQDLNPCLKIAQKQNNPKYSAKFNALNKPEIFNMDKERGYYEKQPPLGVNATAGFVQVDGPPGTTGLDLPDDTTGISGLFHSHNNVDGSVKIFSPTDVRTFINTFLKNAREYGGGYGNAFSTVVTSAGSYTLKYTGTTHPGGVNYDTGQIWEEWYEKEIQNIMDKDGNLPQDKVENVFSRFLKEVVNKPGLEVFKVTANTAIKLTYNSITKETDKDNCPH